MKHITKKILINNEETNYTISTDGTVTNTKTGKALKHALCGLYFKVSIMHKKQLHSMYVHRLLALHFLEVPEGLKNAVVDHKNDNRLDNSLSNLNWISQSDNLKKATRSARSVISEDIKKELINKYHNEKLTGAALAKEYGLPLPSVYTICNRKNK